MATNPNRGTEALNEDYNACARKLLSQITYFKWEHALSGKFWFKV